MPSCCTDSPASCIVCDRDTCMTCRKLVADWPSERGVKTAVRTCIACDPKDEYKLGRMNDHDLRAMLERTGERVAVLPHMDNTDAECRNVGRRTLIVDLMRHDCCLDCNDAAKRLGY